MQEIMNEAFQIVTKVQENSKNALKELKTLKASFEKGDFSKLAEQIESNSFKSALDALKLEYLYSNLKEALEKYTTGRRIDFDKEFLSACYELNLRDIQGNSMSEFRIRGILHVKINFLKKNAEIKTFACLKKINSIDPRKIAQEAKKEIVRLFERPFEVNRFLMDLFKSYQKLQTESTKSILLKDIHRILWIEKQKDNFFEMSDPAKMIPYPLDEFSIDLAKLMESKVQTTNDGYACKISLGSGGIDVYGSDGNFNAYKFIEFVKGEENA